MATSVPMTVKYDPFKNIDGENNPGNIMIFKGYPL